MHILLIIEGTYPWYRGGVSEWVYQYLSHLKEYEFSILQIATDEFSDCDPEEALYPLTNNIRSFERISPPEIYSGVDSLDHWAYKVINEYSGLIESADVYHTTNTGFAGWLGAKFKEIQHKPLLLTEHAIYWKEIEFGAVALECGYKIPQNKIEKSAVVSLFKDLARTSYKLSDKVVSVSKINVSEQETLNATNPEYIPNGISKSWLSAEKERDLSRKPVIGWVGRCAEMKNPLDFIKLAELSLHSNFEGTYTMLLSDANEVELANKVKELSAGCSNLTLVWNKASEVFYDDFDFLCITSHNESQPLVMLEALAKQVLPVSYPVGDFNESYGYVVSKKDGPSGLLRGIKDLWSIPERYVDRLSLSHSKVKREHIWDGIFDQYKEIWQKIS